jgi:hypothetical protein
MHLFLYDFNHTEMKVRNLDGHIQASERILNLVSLMFKFHTLDAVNRPSDTMTVYARAAPSPPNLSTLNYFRTTLNVYK